MSMRIHHSTSIQHDKTQGMATAQTEVPGHLSSAELTECDPSWLTIHLTNVVHTYNFQNLNIIIMSFSYTLLEPTLADHKLCK